MMHFGLVKLFWVDKNEIHGLHLYSKPFLLLVIICICRERRLQNLTMRCVSDQILALLLRMCISLHLVIKSLWVVILQFLWRFLLLVVTCILICLACYRVGNVW